MVTESVMVQENANAMTIGNQKQTALVIILNWIWLDYSLFSVKWNKTLSEFVCKDNVDCNGKGSCENSKCDCLPRWDSFADCHGEYCIKIDLISCHNQLWKCSTIITFKWMNILQLSGYGSLIILISLAFVCFINNDCNSHGTCDDGACICDIDWDVKSDCSGNIQSLLYFWSD